MKSERGSDDLRLSNGRNCPEFLIVHESDSSWGTVEDIDEWHRARGFRSIGYHYVIGNAYPTAASWRKHEPVVRLDGKLRTGRSLGDPDDVDMQIGAHCLGFNTRSIGVCLIGKHGCYSEAQVETLYDFLEGKCRQYSIPPERILGHCETESGRREGKACPSLDMETTRKIIRSRLMGRK
ncbi:N-acetylmuramoyl-L-alanine amidase [Vulgatibacter incomptus]|nr:N-acetylmuramoyl-L-alanine amidase [Vulgatibacter incomptus]